MIKMTKAVKILAAIKKTLCQPIFKFIMPILVPISSLYLTNIMYRRNSGKLHAWITSSLICMFL